MSEVVLRLEGVARRFQQGRGAVLDVLRNVDLSVEAGQIVALVGPSGAGKSTLLQIAGLLERPSDGAVVIDNQNCADLGEEARTRLRGRTLGFVYQYHHLLPEFSALENVTLPQLIIGRGAAAAKTQSTELLTTLGLGERLSHRPAQLSGGEQQRVAIARALANAPKLLLADEPTGNLDPATAGDVFAVLMDAVRTAGLAALIATHNPELAKRMDRIIRLENGTLVEDS